MADFICKCLTSIGYDVRDKNGNSCRILNGLDMLVLIVYVCIVIYNTCISGVNGNASLSTLTYIATSAVSLRTLLKFWIKERTLKKDKESVSITHTIGMVAYCMITGILILGYFFINNEELAKILLIVYYVLFAIFEITEILVRCFDAEPHKYKR